MISKDYKCITGFYTIKSTCFLSKLLFIEHFIRPSPLIRKYKHCIIVLTSFDFNLVQYTSNIFNLVYLERNEIKKNNTYIYGNKFMNQNQHLFDLSISIIITCHMSSEFKK